MPAAPAPIVVGRGLTVTYRRGKETVVALDRVDIELGAGELVGLVGPSGSGKTTLLSVLIGWEHPQEGTLTWSAEGELTPTAPGDRSWHHLAVVPQALGLLDELNLYDNVTLPLRFCSDRGTSRIGRAGRAGHGDDGRGGEVEADRAGQRTRELLEGLGVAHLGDRLPSETSLGEQQRAAVARALVQSPRLLLADEPTAHQDRDHATAVAAALRSAAEDGACCLVATHDPEVLANFDRVLTMRDGALA